MDFPRIHSAENRSDARTVYHFRLLAIDPGHTNSLANEVILLSHSQNGLNEENQSFGFDFRFKSEMHSELASQIIRLENVFNACTERHLEQPNITLNDLNCIVRSYTNRKCELVVWRVTM